MRARVRATYSAETSGTPPLSSSPAREGRASGGQRRFVDPLARAAVAAGVSAVFLEVHDAPERAPSDAAVQLPLDRLSGLLRALAALHALVGG